jgi:hypothetical protein
MDPRTSGRGRFGRYKHSPTTSAAPPGHEGAAMLRSHHHRSAMRPHLCPLEFPKRSQPPNEKRKREKTHLHHWKWEDPGAVLLFPRRSCCSVSRETRGRKLSAIAIRSVRRDSYDLDPANWLDLAASEVFKAVLLRSRQLMEGEFFNVLFRMDSDVWKSELSVFVSAKNVNMDIRIRIRF